MSYQTGRQKKIVYSSMEESVCMYVCILSIYYAASLYAYKDVMNIK